MTESAAAAEPTALRPPMTERQALAYLTGSMATFLDLLLEQTRKDLLELHGVDRQDGEVIVRVGRDLLVGMRENARALEKEPSRIVPVAR